MMVKVLSMVFMLFICGVVLSAQEEVSPLESRSTVWYSFLVRPPSTCQCLMTHLLPQKQRPVLSLDIPVSPLWDMIKEDRIQNRTIQFGGTTTPWKDTVMFGGWPVPRLIFAMSDFRTVLEGGSMKTLEAGPSRTMKQADGTIEGAVWHVLVGADSFFGQEQIPGIIKGLNFDADFRRRSHGGQGWLGVKFGDFNRSFVAGRYGRGHAWTEGETRFIVPSIVDELDWFYLYLEEFRMASVSVEGKIRLKRISQSVRFDVVEYKRVFPSPDPLRFGENHLQDMWLRTETEVIPFSHARFLRGVVILTKDFRDQNRLMFTNDYSSVRVFFRLSFD